MIVLSLLRIVFTPTTGSAVMVCDWLQPVLDLTLPPWQQQVQTDMIVEADFASVIARGNVARSWSLTTRTEYANAQVMHAAELARDASMPAGVTGSLSVRLLDPSLPDDGTEAERTSAWWLASTAAIVSRVPRPVPEKLAVDATWTLSLGALVEQA